MNAQMDDSLRILEERKRDLEEKQRLSDQMGKRLAPETVKSSPSPEIVPETAPEPKLETQPKVEEKKEKPEPRATIHAVPAKKVAEKPVKKK